MIPRVFSNLNDAVILCDSKTLLTSVNSEQELRVSLVVLNEE